MFGALGDTTTDGRTAYLTWVAQVRAAGGVATSYPLHTTITLAGDAYGIGMDAYGVPAARFAYGAGPGAPDGVSLDWEYYIAPESVIDYAVGGGNLTAPQSVPGEQPLPNPEWYDKIVTALKAGGWIVGGIAVLGLVSVLPHRHRN